VIRWLCSAFLIAAFATPLAETQHHENEGAMLRPRDARGLQRPRPADLPPAPPEKLQRMQRPFAKIQLTSDSSERKRLLKQHLQLIREQMDLIRAAPASLGVATLSPAAPGGNGHTVVFGEGSDCAGTLALHKVIIDRLAALEIIVDQVIEREAFESALAPRK